MSLLGYSQSQIGIINDKDGFVNIRVDKSSKSEIIGKILKNEYFTFFEDNASNWWIIESKTGLIGYVHKSRISFIKKGYLQKGKLLDKNVEISFSEYLLNEISINIFQLKPKNNHYDFSCKGLIRIIKENKLVDQIGYPEIEPVGSSYGITFSKKQDLSTLFIASKFGDYNGEIIVVDSNGKITTFEGGVYFITDNGKFLISTWDSDLSGLTIYDLENKQIRLNRELKEYLGDWYYNGDIYYAPVWDGEKTINKTFQIDFKDFQLKSSILKISDGRKIEEINPNCNCE